MMGKPKYSGLAITRAKIADISKRFHTNQRGATTLALALMILPILGLMGLAIDGITIYTVQNGMRAALDSAGLAAMQVESPERQKVAQSYFSANTLGLGGQVVNTMTLDMDEQDNRISLAATADVETAFARLFGFNTIKVRVYSAIEQGSSGRVEIALVIDTSFSMQGSRMQSVKQGANTLINTLFGSQNSVSNVWMSFIPYTGVINIGGNRRGWAHGQWFDWIFWNGCINNRVNGEKGDAPPSHGKFRIAFALQGCNKVIQPLTDNKNTARHYISTLQPSLLSSTRGDYGILWGWRSISPRWRADWGLHDIADYNVPGVEKIVVLLTDGANANTHADAQQTAACSQMKNLGIVIYTIGLQLNTSRARNVLMSCASSPDHFFQSANPKALEQAFSNIGDQITTLRVVN